MFFVQQITLKLNLFFPFACCKVVKLIFYDDKPAFSIIFFKDAPCDFAKDDAAALNMSKV